ISICEYIKYVFITETLKTRKITSLLTTGIGESTLFQKLGDIDELLDGAKLAFLPNQYGVKMRLTVTGKSEEEINDRIIEIEQKIRSVAGRYIYGKNDELLEEVVAKLLIERGLRLSIAESCTGGLISNRLTNISGSSAYFDRGLITYSNAAKVELLHVNEDVVQDKGAVSLEIARQMAEGVRSVSGSDIGLAATGIMGPTGATFDKPVGIVYVGLADDKICTGKEFRFSEDRILNKERTAQAAMEMLRRHLLGIPYDE
ncbi:nicotinamide-nucleotide amidohydrolase family protein, partial [Bacteroidota bacterium]